MTVLTSFLGAARSLAFGASLALLAGCPTAVSLGTNDAGRDACHATCPVGATVSADCQCILSGSDAGADVCTVTCSPDERVASDCMCVPPVCAYRDPQPCTRDEACAANGGVCDTAHGYCVCPAGTDAGTCPATEPTAGTPCSYDGLNCPYGHNLTGCDSDSAYCSGGVWHVISTPGCAPDAGTDACAGTMPCPLGSHFNLAACACVADDAGAGNACGDALTCATGQLCVRHQIEGGAEIFADAGHCPLGRVATACGSMTCCVPAPTYACAATPTACAGALPTCSCAASLCNGGEMCTGVSGTGSSGAEVDCLLLAP